METVSTMGSGTLGREVELEAFIDAIKQSITPVEVNRTSDSIVTLRFSRDGSAFTVYRTGTFQIRGAKSEQELKAAEDDFVDLLGEIGVDVSEYEFDHVTSVFMTDLGQDVNLSALTVSVGLGSAEYEPEQFPGMVYRPDDSEFVLIIFASGKVILTGGRNRKDAEDAVNSLKKYLNKIDQM